MRHRIVGRLLVALVAFSALGGIPAQGQIVHSSGPLPSFEVATIKPFQRDGMPGGPGSVLTTRTFIESAYNLPIGSKERVLGGPGWLDTTLYAIEGKVSETLSTEMKKMDREQRMRQTCLMRQALLADRFHLKVHFETRQMPIYELTVAKGGPKLTLAKEPPPVTPEPGDLARPENTRRGIRVIRKPRNITEMTATEEPLDTLVAGTFLGLDRPLVNKTGLTGKYDFTLTWTPNPSMAPGTNETEGPSIFTALQEQLGLKLVPKIGPVEVIIIDHIELPSEN
jgi:bla regulator protein BlaR1